MVFKSKWMWVGVAVAALAVVVGVVAWTLTAQAAQRERVAAWDEAARDLAATMMQAEQASDVADQAVVDAGAANWEDPAVEELESLAEALSDAVAAAAGEFPWMAQTTVDGVGAQSGAQSGPQSGSEVTTVWSVADMSDSDKQDQAVEAMNAATSALREEVSAVDDLTDAVVNGVSEYLVSVAIEGYAAAVEAANTSVSEGKSVLAETEGKVSDNQVRVALSDALAEVTALLEDEPLVSGSSDVAGIEAQTLTLVKATKTLGEAQALVASDVASKAAADAAAAASVVGGGSSGSAAVSSSDGYGAWSGYSSSGDSSWYSGTSTGGSSTPSQPSTPSTPTTPSNPSSPPANNGGGDDFWYPGHTGCMSSDGSTWLPDANGNC